MADIFDSWKRILNKYGENASFLEQQFVQPNYSFTFDVNYQQTAGTLGFYWDDARNRKIRGKDLNILRHVAEDITGVTRTFDGYTRLLMELPHQHNYVKIFNTGHIYNVLAPLFRHRIKTGSQAFDHAFITIAKPATIISKIASQLDYFLDPDFGGSLALETDFEHAVSRKFFLHLRVNILLTEESHIEKLLYHTELLAKKLNESVSTR